MTEPTTIAELVEQERAAGNPDFDPRFYESLGTLRPPCVSRYGGATTGSDHDHRCEFDADEDDPAGYCWEWVRGHGGQPVRQEQFHACRCGRGWGTGARSVSLAGEEIVS